MKPGEIGRECFSFAQKSHCIWSEGLMEEGWKRSVSSGMLSGTRKHGCSFQRGELTVQPGESHTLGTRHQEEGAHGLGSLDA